MQVEVKVPMLSESVSEATLVAWHKKVGEAVKRDENLIDIETDKVVMELPAPADGVLAKILKADGGQVASGEVIAVIDTEAKGVAAPAPAATDTASAAVKAAAAPAPSAGAANAPSPSASKIAAEQGIDTAKLSGTGRDGRVTKTDVLAASAPAAAPAPAAAAAPAARPAAPVPLGSRPEQRVPMSRLRARVAERLVQSQATAAILTNLSTRPIPWWMEPRARQGGPLREGARREAGLHVLFVKAAVAALRKFPVVNASIDGNDIVYYGYYDIGTRSAASAAPRGAHPAQRRPHVHRRHREGHRGLRQAREGGQALPSRSSPAAHSPSPTAGSSARCSPRRSSTRRRARSSASTPMKDRAVVENGQVVRRYLALSYDHRIIDGSAGGAVPRGHEGTPSRTPPGS